MIIFHRVEQIKFASSAGVYQATERCIPSVILQWAGSHRAAVNKKAKIQPIGTTQAQGNIFSLSSPNNLIIMEKQEFTTIFYRNLHNQNFLFEAWEKNCNSKKV